MLLRPASPASPGNLDMQIFRTPSQTLMNQKLGSAKAQQTWVLTSPPGDSDGSSSLRAPEATAGSSLSNAL